MGPISKFGIGVAFILSVACILGVLGHPKVFSGELASWVQAIGTIGAMAVAIWAGQAPVREEHRRREERVAGFAKAVRAGVGISLRNTAPLREAVRQKSDAFGPISLAVRDPFAGLDKLLAEPLTDWPSVELYISASSTRRVMQDFLDYAQMLSRGLRNTASPADEEWELLNNLARKATSMADMLRANADSLARTGRAALLT